MPASTTSAPASPARRALLAGFILLCLSITWFGLAANPLSDRSEGRYAVVSMNMAESGNWLVPTFGGQPHLTKPPLTYWLEAGCLLLLGHNELAVRLPSAIAGSLALLLVLGFVWRTAGPRHAIAAAAVLAVMPMFAVMNRLTITDALLNLFWFGTLAAGVLALREPLRERWPALLWLCVALGLLTKGPLAWVPVGLMLIWLALGGRWREVRVLRLGWGMALSLLPLAGWVFAVWWLHPGAATVWWDEMYARTGLAAAPAPHPKPVWYFLPIFVGGLFPATLMLMLPGLNYSWRSAWAVVRQGREISLWVIAVIVPLVMFSSIRGKLPSYLLPLCAPMAILTAQILQHSMRGPDDRNDANDYQQPEIKLPRVGDWLCIAAVAIGVASTLLLLAPMQWLVPAAQSPTMTHAVGGTLVSHTMEFVRSCCWWLLPAGLALAAAGAWLRWVWHLNPQRRGEALAVLWIAFVLFYLAAFASENRLQTPTGDVHMLAALEAATGLHQPKLVRYGITDSTLTFYNDRAAPFTDSTDKDGPEQIRNWLKDHPRDLVIFAESREWEKLAAQDPQLTRQFTTVLAWKVWSRDKPRLLLRPIAAATTMAPATKRGNEEGDEGTEER